MADPYKVLGVSPNASDEEVKAAYRELARKYHPDNYEGNPLSDLASQKMQEINAAYDDIMTQRKNGYTGGADYRSYQGGGASQFSDIRRLINARRVTEAEELLDGVPQASRDAEWYFLKGNVQYTRGWLDDAYESFSRACQMNPNNPEYASALNQLQWQRQTGRPAGRGYRTDPGMTRGGCSACDVCTALYCTDCCCECMGGDFIRCC
ncbi:MAG: DnaJ domain-containing protein [Oscillospiraceae bacterium]|jgi:curved DNA-binding protein CbpA|nr:DnaJ domain-containing protein [Oscillospiraceae bacterium]